MSISLDLGRRHRHRHRHMGAVLPQSCASAVRAQRLSRILQRHASMPAMPAKPSFAQIHWVLDWDGTITRHDTLSALVNLAASYKPDFPVTSKWERLSQDYVSDYTSDWEALTGRGRLPKTVQEERELLQSLTVTEMRSLRRVSASGIFSGLTRQQLDEGAAKAIEAKHVELRRGYTEFSQMHRRGDMFNILSVNWSRHFIGACLHAAGASLEPASIYANELEGIDAGRRSNGELLPEGGMHIVSSADKLHHLKQLQQRQRNQAHKETIATVYVGDSRPDIECLLAADVGICIRDDAMSSSQKALFEDLQRLQVRCRHVGEWEWEDRDEWNVVWARDFEEIRAWVDSLGARAS
jgi:2-hydroxy-3-keto-5-methylthiopentenyl-1-phosphate phosphatase